MPELTATEQAWRRKAGTVSLPEVHRSVLVPPNASFLRKLLAFSGPGFLVAVGDVGGMTEQVVELLSRPDRARQIGQCARQTVVERCDIERVWPRYARAIHEAAWRAGRAPAVERA